MLQRSARFDPEPVAELIAKADFRVLAVDDGSTDATAARLADLAARHPDRVAVLTLERNHGKGEAVRLGLREAVAGGAEPVAYCDADFAAPPAEVRRLIGVLRADMGLDAVIASRVAMLGTEVRTTRQPVGNFPLASTWSHATLEGPRQWWSKGGEPWDLSRCGRSRAWGPRPSCSSAWPPAIRS